jgi:RHS repeat-associated protein
MPAIRSCTRVYLLVFVFVVLATGQAAAQCTMPSLTNVRWVGNALGHGTLMADYTFHPGGNQPFIEVSVNGDPPFKHYMGPGSGTFSTSLNTTCWNSGTYLIRVSAVECQSAEYSATSTTTIDVDTKPDVSGLTASIDETGWASISAQFRFRNTPDGQRILRRHLNGGSYDYFVGLEGTLTDGVSTACMPNGPHQLDMVAIGCGNDPFDVESTVLTVDHTPVFEEATVVLPAAGNEVDVRVTYRFPQTNHMYQRNFSIDWLPSATTPARNIATWWVAIPGRETHTFRVARQQHDEFIAVGGVSCGDTYEYRVLKIPGKETECCTHCNPQPCVGDPVHLASGNTRMTDREPLPGDLAGEFGRTFDTTAERRGVFGTNWTSPFDAWLRTAGNFVLIGTGGNDRVVFGKPANVYKQYWPSEGTKGELRAVTGGYDYRPASGDLVYEFRQGRLTGMRRVSNGDAVQLIYDTSGRPTTVRDVDGRWQWNLITDPAAGLVTSIAVDMRPDLVWTYQYDTAGGLLSITAPGGSPWRTYGYSGNRLTEARDALGNLIESHSYNAAGHARTSYGPGGEISNIEYGLPGRKSGETATRVTSAAGAVTTYYLRYIGNRARTVEVDGGCTSCGSRNAVYAYDDDGMLMREQNADGYITEYEYAPNGQISRRRAPLRPATCDPSTATDRCRQTTDALMDVPLSTTASTIETEYAYGDANWFDKATSITTTSVRSATGTRREELTYDPLSGQVVEHRVIGWTGDPAVQQTRTTSNVLYDGTESAAFPPGGSFPPAWLTLAQPRGERKATDGPRTDVADTTSFVYYPMDASVSPLLRGRLAATKNAAGHIVRFEGYDVFGNVLRSVDPNGVATEMTYDALGRLATSTIKGIPGCNTSNDPLCGTDLTSTFTYAPAAGPLQNQVQPGGGTTVYTYDSRGRVQTVSRGPSATDLRERIETAYDSLTGRKSVEQTLAFKQGSWVEQRRESYAYNNLGELTTVTHADDTSAGYAYDASGRIASMRDENHASPNTFYDYDAAGRLESVRQTLAGAPGGAVWTSYGYDLHGNLNQVIDPNGNLTSYTYDDFGQLLSQVSPVTGTTTYTYDAAGNLAATTDARTASSVTSYDALGRPTRTDSTLGDVTDTVIRIYDSTDVGRFAVGRVATMTDPAGATEYSYERRGLLREEARSFAKQAPVVPSAPALGPVSFSTSHTAVTRFTWNHDGGLASLAYPSGELTVSYGYDFAGRPVTASGFVLGASYEPFGPVTEIRFANYTTQKLAYTNRYRITSNQLVHPEMLLLDPIVSHSYAHDSVGNVTAIDDQLDPAYSKHFAYDDLHRLVSANTGPNPVPDRSERATLWGKGSYSWDAMGNLRSLELGEIEPNTDPEPMSRFPGVPSTQANVPHGRSTVFDYAGSTPKVVGVTTNDLLRTVTHDAAGNETGYVATRSYSPRNLMATVTDSSGEDEPVPHQVRYAYDGRGLRVARMESPANGPATSAWRYYTYSPGLRLLSASRDDSENVWAPEASPAPAVANNTHYEIIWFGDRPVGQVTPGAPTRFTLADHLGTPFLQTDSTRSVVWHVEYEPFGNVYAVREGTRTDQPLRFPGQEVAMAWEGGEENYNVFRWYRGGWGRYTQADPIGIGGGLNLYGYVGGNPLGNIDPLGLVTWTQNAPAYHADTQDNVFFKCGDHTAHGCTLLSMDINCKCKCESGSFKAKINLKMSLNVWVRQDDPAYTVPQIINEEMKHVKYWQVMFKWAIKRGEQLEGQSFTTWWQCDDACKAYKQATYKDFASDWVHENNPHP